MPKKGKIPAAFKKKAGKKKASSKMPAAFMKGAKDKANPALESGSPVPGRYGGKTKAPPAGKKKTAKKVAKRKTAKKRTKR